ncbi:hypothetical protein WDU94_007657 [Cyamophila willieti]
MWKFLVFCARSSISVNFCEKSDIDSTMGRKTPRIEASMMGNGPITIPGEAMYCSSPARRPHPQHTILAGSSPEAIKEERKEEEEEEEEEEERRRRRKKGGDKRKRGGRGRKGGGGGGEEEERRRRKEEEERGGGRKRLCSS